MWVQMIWNRVEDCWFSAVIQWYSSSEDQKSKSNDMVIREIGYGRHNRPTGYMNSCVSEDSDVQNVLLNEDKHIFFDNNDVSITIIIKKYFKLI